MLIISPSTARQMFVYSSTRYERYLICHGASDHRNGKINTDTIYTVRFYKLFMSNLQCIVTKWRRLVIARN